MAIGSDITAVDFNALQAKIEDVLGDRVGSTYGYGQTIQSSPVTTGELITLEQWNALRDDIKSIKVHQDGVSPSIVDPGSNTGGVVRWTTADAILNYNALIDQARSNKYSVATGQYSVSAIGPGNETPTPVAGVYEYSSTWTSSLSFTITLTFSTANKARYFFNSGGKVRISASRTGGTVKAQNNAWTEALDAIGEVDFGAGTNPLKNFYTLTNSYTPYFQSSLSTPYSNNVITLDAKCNVANNSTGTASVVDIRVTLDDSYVDPGNAEPIYGPADGVDGTVTFNLSEIKASGYLQPSPDAGAFAIDSPVYSVSTISAT
jgi:hypothetical protein